MTRQPVTDSPIGRRTVVVGSTCSGKSTLAAELARRIDAPFVELDALFWLPEWTQSDDDPAVAGNYRRVSMELLWPRTATMVWLDYPLPLILRRVVARSWRRWRTDELLWGTNHERFWRHLKLWSREDSLIAWALTTHHSRRRRFSAHMRDPRWSQASWIRLRSPRETERWLADTPRSVSRAR